MVYPAHHNVQGEDEVVQQCVGRHLLVQLATDGKQLSGCPYGRVEAGVQLLEGGLVFPVKAFAAGCSVGFVLYGDALFSGHTAHFGIGECAYNLAQCFTVEVCIGIGEYHKRGGDRPDAAVQCGGLSFSLGLIKHGGLRPVRETFVGAVVAAVRYPEYVQLVCRIVQGKAVAHFIVYDIFFIIGSNE